MTTIAYRDGVMAADTSSVFSGIAMMHNIAKVVRYETPERVLLGGCAGGTALCAQFRQWVLDGAAGYPNAGSTKDDEIGILALLAELDKGSGEVTVWVYEPDGAYKVSDEYLAVGSGMQVALGAFYAGAGPKLAVEAAVAFDVNTNGWVDEVSFKRRGRKRVNLGKLGKVTKRAKNA